MTDTSALPAQYLSPGCWDPLSKGLALQPAVVSFHANHDTASTAAKALPEQLYYLFAPSRTSFARYQHPRSWPLLTPWEHATPLPASAAIKIWSGDWSPSCRSNTHQHVGSLKYAVGPALRKQLPACPLHCRLMSVVSVAAALNKTGLQASSLTGGPCL